MNLSERPLYGPNSQDTSRFTLPPWTRLDILIGANGANAPDRSQGVLLPEIMGEGMYIERADWPVLLNPVVSTGPEGSFAVQARDGLSFKAPFKGLWLQHPVLNTGVSQQSLKLSLIIFRAGGPSDVLANELSSPLARALVSFRQPVNTAVQQTYTIFVPQGARALENISLGLAATTITGATASSTDNNGAAIVAPSVTQQIAAAVQTYNAANAGYPAANVELVGAYAVITWPRVPVTSQARELTLSVTGTGLAAGAGIGGYWI